MQSLVWICNGFSEIGGMCKSNRLAWSYLMITVELSMSTSYSKSEPI